MIHATTVLYLAFACYISLSAAVLPPTDGHSYVLYNAYGPTNPYQYLAWSTSSSEAVGASSSTPGLYMAKGSAGNPPAHSLWVFDKQSDGTYRIYNADNSYPGSSYERLDVQNDGVKLFMGVSGTTNTGQVWQLFSLDDISMQIHNKGWNKNLDIDGNGLYTNVVNAPFMNSASGTNLAGQAWYYYDFTPTKSVTATSVVTSTSYFTPNPTTNYVGGSQKSVTSTSIVYTTVTTTITSTAQASISKRADNTFRAAITITSTVSTYYSTTVIPSTLQAAVVTVTTNGGTNTIVSTITSAITETIVSVVGGTTSVVFTQTASVGTTHAPSPTTSSKSQTSSTSTSTSTSTPSSSKATALAAGLGGGLGFAALASILAVAFFIIRRRRRDQEAQYEPRVVTTEAMGIHDSYNRHSNIPPPPRWTERAANGEDMERFDDGRGSPGGRSSRFSGFSGFARS